MDGYLSDVIFGICSLLGLFSQYACDSSTFPSSAKHNNCENIKIFSSIGHILLDLFQQRTVPATGHDLRSQLKNKEAVVGRARHSAG